MVFVITLLDCNIHLFQNLLIIFDSFCCCFVYVSACVFGTAHRCRCLRFVCPSFFSFSLSLFVCVFLFSTISLLFRFFFYFIKLCECSLNWLRNLFLIFLSFFFARANWIFWLDCQHQYDFKQYWIYRWLMIINCSK